MTCKRLIGFLPLFVVAVALPVTAKADRIYDNFSPFDPWGQFFYDYHAQFGDRVVLPDAGAGNNWTLNTFTARYGVAEGGSWYYDNVARVRVYQTINTEGIGPAFSNLIGTATQDLPDWFSPNGGFVGDIYTMTDMNLEINVAPTDPTLGYGLLVDFYQAPGARSQPGAITPSLVGRSSTVPGSGSSPGWYRDKNQDWILGADEYELDASGGWPDNQLQFELDATATPVPEPMSMVGLGIAFTAFLTRRKRKQV